MIIIRQNWRGDVAETSVAEAVRWACTPEPYSHNGQLERLEATIQLQRDMLARLIETLELTDAQLQNILGSEFTIKP